MSASEIKQNSLIELRLGLITKVRNRPEADKAI